MIHIVTALLHEARPIIDLYSLKPAQSDPYQIYQNDQISLIVSGVGKQNSKDAVTYLYEYSGKKRNCAWLNFGIGGHAKKKLGEALFLAHKITDQKTGKSWYPPRILKSVWPSEIVLTVETVEDKYEGNFIYDMEAAGFYEAASSYSVSELVQCLKIVSDNLTSPAKRVTGSLVRTLISKQLHAIDSVVKEMGELSDRLLTLESPLEESVLFLKHWHFTVTESHQLRSLLGRLKTLAPEKKWFSAAAGCSKAKQVIEFLEKQIQSIPVRL